MIPLAGAPAPRPDTGGAHMPEHQIANLGADEWKTRDTATSELMQYGKQLAPELETVAKDEDPEVRHRAKLILESFAAPATPMAAADTVGWV
ncbi:hypothetical protein IIC65_07960 [Candidatus Sumerlaeota bacterium]|nr:hypothetical protein [Candidatus Sumerlaeota bacterium]